MINKLVLIENNNRSLWNKSATKMERYILKLSSFETHFCKMMCSLMESQILVDMTITCKSYSLKVHKNVLAARSEYFREKLQKDLSIDSVLINGMKPSVLKSLVTFIYCGGTSVAVDDMSELISAGDYFRVPGIKSILKDKFKIDLSKKPDLNLNEAPPLFFSKNVKISTSKSCNSLPAGILSAKCNAPGRSKEARCLLVKEQVASEQALKEVQRNKSKLIVTEDTSTVVTVEADLTAGFDDPIQVEEFIIENFNKNSLKQTVPEDSYGDQINEVFVLQPDDENFVDNNARVFEELSNGHTVSYQLIPQNKSDLEIQEYICNTINDYTVNSATNICFIPENTEPKFQMTYAQLSSEAVDVNYITNEESDIILENHYSNSQTNAVNQNYISKQDIVIENHNSNIETDAINENYISKPQAVIENYNSNIKTKTPNEHVSNLETAAVSLKYNPNLESDIGENNKVDALFNDLENTNSLDIMSVSQKTTISGNELVVVADSYDEDSSKSIFEKSLEWKKNPMLTYNIEEFSDNAVEYAEKLNPDNRRTLKRKHENNDLCLNSTNTNTSASEADNNIQYFHLDEAINYSKNENCDFELYAKQSSKVDCSVQQNDSLFSETVPEQQNITSNILLQEAELQDKHFVCEDNKNNNDCEDKSHSFSQYTKTAIDILSFGDSKVEEILSLPSENRRQTRSLTKHRAS